MSKAILDHIAEYAFVSSQKEDWNPYLVILTIKIALRES